MERQKGRKRDREKERDDDINMNPMTLCDGDISAFDIRKIN